MVCTVKRIQILIVSSITYTGLLHYHGTNSDCCLKWLTLVCSTVIPRTALGDTDLSMYTNRSPRWQARKESGETAGTLEFTSEGDPCILFGDDEESALSLLFISFTLTLKNKKCGYGYKIISYQLIISTVFMLYLFKSQEITNLFGKLMSGTWQCIGCAILTVYVYQCFNTFHNCKNSDSIF